MCEPPAFLPVPPAVVVQRRLVVVRCPPPAKNQKKTEINKPEIKHKKNKEARLDRSVWPTPKPKQPLGPLLLRGWPPYSPQFGQRHQRPFLLLFI
jgi:hypothetical protein